MIHHITLLDNSNFTTNGGPMDFISKKEKNESTKFPETNRVIGNAAMLQNYSLNPVIQCMRFEELEAKLREELEVEQEAARILDDTDKAEQTVPKEDEGFVVFPDEDPKSIERKRKEQELREQFYTSIGKITYMLDLINYNIAPNKQEIFALLSKPETIANYMRKLLHTFQYANEVFTKISREAELTEPFQAFVATAENVKEITISVLNADLHGFDSPIKLEAGGMACVYKDRLGFADKIVTDLFKEINTIMVRVLMPAYEQHAFKDKGLLSEFIDGEQRNHPPYPSENFRGNAKNLKALQWVAKEIGLTDLHLQNVVFTADERLVPIDLEAFEAGMPTGLFPPHRNQPRADAAPSQTNTALPPKSLPVHTTETIPEQSASGSSASSDDYVLRVPAGQKLDFQPRPNTSRKPIPPKTDIGNPDELDPLSIFDDAEHFSNISKAIAAAQKRLYETPKRLVPVSTTGYKDSWERASRGIASASIDMTQKTIAAFQKRNFKIETDILQATMDKLVHIEHTIPIFIRQRDDILQFDTETGDWVLVARFLPESSQATPDLPSSQ